MHLTLALLISFNIAFWLYISQQKKKKKEKKATVDHCFIPGVNFCPFGFSLLNISALLETLLKFLFKQIKIALLVCGNTSLFFLF
jgi:hypothetical protein